MRKDRVAQFKKRLVEKHRQLSEEVGRTALYVKDQEDDSIKDLGDQANTAYTREFFFELGNGDRRLLRDVISALQKIDDGSFGNCERCGEEISEKRLEALPFARYCIECQRAIEQDPMYAPPHAGLAQASGVAGFFGYLPPSQAFAQMKAHAMAALKLDANLADAHACLAAVHLFYEWDWSAAENRFLTALGENPNHALAREWHGWCLVAQGRLERPQ